MDHRRDRRQPAVLRGDDAMKANYATMNVTQLDREIKKGVMKELEAYKDEVYEKVTLDVFEQAIAVCLYTLEAEQGWKETRLRRFVVQLEDTCHLLTQDIFGKKITTRDILKHMKEKYNIDLSESRYLWE